MKLKQLLTDDDAVSPVIGVILMVAITVILAAVIGAFVLGIGGDQAVAPQTSFDYDYDESASDVTVTHTGGDSFQADNVGFAGASTDDWGGSDTISAGDSSQADVDSSLGETLRVVWNDPDSDDSNVIGTYQVPE